MIFRQRPQAPSCLTETSKTKWGIIQNQEKWGKVFEDKKNNPNKKNKFQWATFKKKKVNKLVEPVLKEMTQGHCAFCDAYPLQPTRATIEHFRPKNQFPLLSYIWENLFYCCHACQEKGEKFDEKLLKPDETSYDFDNYFIYRTAGKHVFLEPNPLINAEDQERAKITIELYGLNEFGRPEDRWRVTSQYNDSNNPIIDEFSYRYLFM